MRTRDFLWLCHRLGIIVNPSKSSLVPTQTMDYLGMTIANSPLEGFPDPQTGAEVVPPSSGVSICPPPSCVSVASSSRSDVLLISHSPRCSSPYEVPPASPQCLRSSAPQGGPGLLGRWLPERSSVVVRRPPSFSRPPSRRGPPRPLSLLRRFRPGLGRCSWRPPPLWLVVSPLLELFYQPARVVGRSLCSLGFSALPPGSRGCAVLGQLHSPGVSPETGRDSIFHLEHGRSGTPPTLRVSVGSSASPVHSQPSQCSGGLAQPSLPGPRFGVDVVSSGCGRAPLPVAGRYRPFRDFPEPSPACVLLPDCTTRRWRALMPCCSRGMASKLTPSHPSASFLVS